MSPKPVEDVEDDIETPPVPPPRRAGIAKPSAEAPTVAAVQEVVLPEETLHADMPIIRARVVYLGPGEHHAISFTGQIYEQWIEDPDSPITRKDRAGTLRHYTVIKKAVPSGTSQYDFTIRDQRGHLIPMRMMPEGSGSKLTGRPFSWVEHVGHLRRFFLAVDERGQKIYQVMALPKDIQALQDHVRRSERARRASEQFFADVVKG